MSKSLHPNETNFRITALKTFEGREGIGYTCNLYLNDKKVGSVRDTANGGPVEFDIKEEAMIALKEEAKAFYGEDSHYDEDCYIEELTIMHEVNQSLKRKCKNKVYLKLVTDNEDTYTVINQKWQPQFEKQLKDRHGDDLVEIINLRFV